ncbi:MAG: hypothetical protein US97_C0007G0011 [Microgenomates group bacterium GW2011_GWF1_38_5]|nr:MAG: hypothetical protein US97_C0007G0011 [Microgenomates group bacterium GW2011_GWF1_38_5]
MILTPLERELGHLLFKERLSVREVSRRRGVSLQAVYKIRQKLIKGNGYLKVEKNEIGIQPLYSWDLHGCAWRCSIHYGKEKERYKRVIGEGVARVSVLGATVELCRDVVEVHANQGFSGDVPEVAVAASWNYLWRVIDKLENDYGVVLRKDRCPIRRFRGHFAHVDDALAKVPGGSEIRVFADDGKLRFVVDWSKVLVPEAEFPHSALAQGDTREYSRFLVDIMDREHFDLSEVSQQSAKITAQLLALSSEVRELGFGLRGVVDVQRFVLESMKNSVNIENKDYMEKKPDYMG